MQNISNGYAVLPAAERVPDLRANRRDATPHIVAMNYMFMNETTDYTNSPKIVTHDSCSQRILAVKKKGDSAHVKNNVANIIGGLGY